MAKFLSTREQGFQSNVPCVYRFTFVVIVLRKTAAISFVYLQRLLLNVYYKSAIIMQEKKISHNF